MTNENDTETIRYRLVKRRDETDNVCSYDFDFLE